MTMTLTMTIDGTNLICCLSLNSNVAVIVFSDMKSRISGVENN
jgi:hypothetical protein